MKAALLLAAIHDRFCSQPVTEDHFTQLFDGYGIDDDSKFPSWFICMLEAVANQQDTHFKFDDVGSDIYGILLELSDDFGWPVHDEGEYIDMQFGDGLISVLISREAMSDEGLGCCSCTVECAPQ